MLKIITGDTAGFTFSLVYPGAVADKGTPDLTNAKIKFIVKKNISDPDSRAVFVQEIENPETNKVYFEMSPEDTGKLIAGTYKAGCKVYFDSGLEITVWSDDILVIKGVFNA
jgi:hypothetical protein